jgi:hypothetical protein
MNSIFTGLLVAVVCSAARAQDGSVTQTQETRPAAPGQNAPGAPGTGAVHGILSDEQRLEHLTKEVAALRDALDRLRGAKPAGDPVRGLTVNGEFLSKEVIDREMIYLVGSRHLDQKIIEMLIDEQVKEQIKNGASPEKFDVVEKDIQTQIATTKTEWEKANPDKGRFDDFLRMTNTSMEEYGGMVRVQKILDGIFFAGHPRTWPAVTGEAIMASGGEQGQVFWERFRDSVPPVYHAGKPVVWQAVLDALPAAGLTADTSNPETGEISAKLTFTDTPAVPPAVPPEGGDAPPAGPKTAVLTIKVEQKGGAADRTEVKINALDPVDEGKEPVGAAKTKLWDLAAEAVGRSIGKPASETYTGEVPAFWLQICRNWVLKKLIEWSDVRFASEGLPDDQVLMVNGKGWKTADASKLFLQKAKPEDFERAITEIALRTALRQELKKQDQWMTDEEFKKEYLEYSAPFDKTPFTVEVIAKTFKGYPTMEAFKQRWRLLKSYENMIAKEIHDANLKAHIPIAKNFLGDARVNVQYLRIPAFDDVTGTWRENGWARAKVEAEAAMDAIQKGMSFPEAMKTFGKYKPGDTDGGNLGPKSFNELRQKLGESEYLDFVNGYSIAQILLNETQEGQVIGPVRANEGYIIAKLVSRVPPGGVVSVEDEKTRELIKQDYISTRFLKWAGEVAASMKLK